jgi:hypothetical protein
MAFMRRFSNVWRLLATEGTENTEKGLCSLCPLCALWLFIHMKTAIKLFTIALLSAAALLVVGCRQGAGSSSPINSPGDPGHEQGNPFDNFLHTEAAPADGFDFAVGDPDGKGYYGGQRRRWKTRGRAAASDFTAGRGSGAMTGRGILCGFAPL